MALLVLLLVLALAAPGKPLITVSHDGQGWSVASRPLAEIIQRGFFAPSAALDAVRFETSRFASSSGYCTTEVDHAFGPFVFRRLYNWSTPGDDPATAQARGQACEAQRLALIATPGTLAAALKGGDAEDVRRHLDAALTHGSELAIKLTDVGQPMRDTLARLMLLDARSPVTLNRLDVALAVGDKTVAERWLQALPAEQLADHQRYAFYKLGLARAIAQRAAREGGAAQRTRFVDADDADRGVDGFRRSDFAMANAHCDSGYATFLMNKGIAPDDKTVVGAFLTRVAREAPDAMVQLDLSYPYSDLARTIRAGASAAPAACAALAVDYRTVKLSDDAIGVLSYLTGAEMLTRYQQYAKRQMAGKTLATRAEENAFYDALVFDQKTSPLPALPLMFTALLKGRPSGAAACAALSALPRLLDHDAALAAFKTLAESWRGKPLAQPEALAACAPGIVFPASYIARQTRDQNDFLRQAGIACAVSTPKGRYVYNQKVSCGSQR